MAGSLLSGELEGCVLAVDLLDKRVNIFGKQLICHARGLARQRLNEFPAERTESDFVLRPNVRKSIILTSNRRLTNKDPGADMKNRYLFFGLFLLAFVAIACSSVRQPLRPDMRRNKKRNCDCSPWSYHMQPQPQTTYVYGRG